MYTFRKIVMETGPKEPCHVENFNLGNSYQVHGKNSEVYNSTIEGATDEFKKHLKFIVSGEYHINYIVLDTDKAYIVTDHGHTFERL